MVHLFLFIILAASPFAESAAESAIDPWGSDSDLTVKRNERQVELESKAVKASVSMILFFQKYISPIDGPRSHYYPTSSQYALIAIQKYGVLKGIALGCDRLLRENKADWVYPIKNERKLDPVR